MQLLKDKRIFIVEDNLTNRAIVQMVLERHGAQTSIDGWGTETVERMRAFAPVDIILMDLMLPDNLSGFDVASELLARPEFRHIPIVAVSAADPVEAMPIARARGFHGFISKPIDFDLFPQQVARVLNSEKVWFGGG